MDKSAFPGHALYSFHLVSSAIMNTGIHLVGNWGDVLLRVDELG
jgi:hypothetical protein